MTAPRSDAVASTRLAARQHRRRGLAFHGDEQRAAHRCRQQRGQRQRRPAVARFGQRISQGCQAGGGSRLAGLVELLVDARRRRRMAQDQAHCREADGDIQEKHAAPAQVLDHQPAQHRAGGQRQAPARAPGGDGRRARDRIGKRDANDGEGRRQQYRCAHALQAAHRGQDRHCRRQVAADRRHRKNDEAGDEHGARTELVAQRTAQDQHGREHQRITVDDPLQAGEAAAEAVVQGAQRHVHDADIELDDEEAEAGGNLDGKKRGGGFQRHDRLYRRDPGSV